MVVEVVEPRRLVGSESSLVWRWWPRTTRHSFIRPRSHATPEIAKETPSPSVSRCLARAL